MPSTWMSLGIGLYVLVFMALVLGIGFLLLSRRKERAPLEFKLLRGAGESLRREIAAMDENFFFFVMGAAFTPIVAAYLVLLLLSKVYPHTQLWIGLLITFIAFGVTAGLTGRWLWRRFARIRNYRLGYLGERTVAESLAPLLAQGYQVFHDLPAENRGHSFNLDHVVVGPTGLFLIETKTRRKGRARPGLKDHEVAYDGQQLVWPWGEDRHGLEQAQAEARWLSDWIRQITGVNVGAKPILALPGWYVKCTARGPVGVVNAKGLVSAIKGRGGIELTSEQVDLIARQLDARCRDVED